MNCKTLLVHLDDGTHSAARTEFALELAGRHDAHLIGLYVVCQDLTQPMFLHGERALVATREAQHDANLKTRRRAFWRRANGPGAAWNGGRRAGRRWKQRSCTHATPTS